VAVLMITLSVAGRGSKHTLECDPSESIGAVKARLAPLVSMAPADLKLIVKGKLWDDDAKTLGSMADAGATVKVMLLGSRRDELAAPPAAWRRLLETVGDGVAWVLPLLRWETLRLGVLGFLRGVGRFFASLVLKQRTE